MRQLAYEANSCTYPTNSAPFIKLVASCRYQLKSGHCPHFKTKFHFKAHCNIILALSKLKRSYGLLCLDFPTETFMYFILDHEGETKYEQHYKPTYVLRRDKLCTILYVDIRVLRTDKMCTILYVDISRSDECARNYMSIY